jgi:nucleotide-binding universal stress UspA family protein
MAGLEEAAGLAALFQAELRGMFVEDEQRFVYYPAGLSAEGGVPMSAPLPDDELEEEAARVRQEGEEIRQAFEQMVARHGVQGEYVQERGNVNALLTRQARAADLVVMGRRGRNDPLDSKEPGPTTETLIHNALRPVLVVPQQPTTNGAVVFAYDGSKGSQRVLTPGTELAAARGARVVVLSIGDDPNLKAEQEQVLQRYWRPYGIQADCRVSRREGRVSDMIVEAARQEKAGLIVMGAFGHNPLHELFFGSTTLETIAQTPCPVLVMG